MTSTSYTDIISAYTPRLLDIGDVQSLISATARTNFLIYGEIHGIRENADIVYTLVHKLGIKRIAIENDPAISDFIGSGVNGSFDFSLIDPDTFDSSILSIEMAKTITTLLREGIIQEIVYIDTFFSDSEKWRDDNTDSPQKREQDLADNILSLDDTLQTMCLMGQWHTQPEIVPLKNEQGETTGEHRSALYRCRQEKPDLAFIHVVYRGGELFNDGRVITLPARTDVPDRYDIVQRTDIDFDLSVPEARRIALP